MEIVAQKTNISRVLIKVIVVNVLNLLVLLGLVALLPSLNTKSLEVQNLNTKSLAAGRAVDAEVLKADVEKESETIDQIKKGLAGDTTVISFIQNIDELKKGGIVTSFEFPVTSTVNDKLGGTGLPVIFSLTGDTNSISQALISISKFPVILRPISLTIKTTDTGLYEAKYGGFLYVQ